MLKPLVKHFVCVSGGLAGRLVFRSEEPPEGCS